MKGGDISIGQRCCEEGYSYEVPKSTAGFAFRAGLGDKQVNYDRKFRTPNDVLAIVMSEYGNGAKKGLTHCAPLDPDHCNDPSAVVILSTEKKGILREQGAITVAQEVLVQLIRKWCRK